MSDSDAGTGDAQTYESWALRVRSERVSFVVPMVAVASVVLAAATLVEEPESAAVLVSGTGAALGILATVFAVGSKSAEDPKNAALVAVVLALLSSACAGAGFASVFGGAGGIASGLLLVSWVFGAVVTPRPPGWLAVILTAHATMYLGLSWTLHPPPRIPWVVLSVLGAGIVIVTSGSVRRFKDDRRDFEAWTKLGGALALLESRRAKLRRETDELGKTARAQVTEALSHAKTTQELEQRLLARVAARSRGLASFVDRASSPAFHVPLARDAMVGGRARIIDRISPAPYDPSYLAADTQDESRPVVVSILDADSPGVAERLAAALATADVVHKALPALVASGVVDDHFVYRIVEHRPGTPLFRAMTRPDMTVWEAVRIAHAVAAILSVAHGQSVYHLALDPYRILLHRSGAAVTVHGAGLVQLWTAARDAPPPRESPVRSTPAYLAPEQARGEPVDGPAADTYALGVLLFEMVAKLHPVVAGLPEDGRGAGAMLTSLEPKAPPALGALIERMIAFEPEERPALQKVDTQLAEIAALGGAPPINVVMMRLTGSTGAARAVREPP